MYKYVYTRCAMKKIEKEKRKNEYNIQSVNKHLINILEENYYIELGNVDIKVLEKLFSGHPTMCSMFQLTQVHFQITL